MRLCTKTACGSRAVASCAFNYAERLVWIISLGREQDPSFYDLCDVHVGTLRVPRGWSLQDHRSSITAEQPSLLS